MDNNEANYKAHAIAKSIINYICDCIRDHSVIDHDTIAEMVFDGWLIETEREVQVGEVREHKGTKYRCLNAMGKDCDTCAFNIENSTCNFPLGPCFSEKRVDNNDVIFVKED